MSIGVGSCGISPYVCPALREGASHVRQRFHLSIISLALIAAGAANLCAAQAGLSSRTTGVGLRAEGRASPPLDPLFSAEATSPWQPKGSDLSLYGGARDMPAFGLGPAEAYSGVAYALPRGWGSSSLEAAYAQESSFAPRRYAVAGQVRTEVGTTPGRALSAGIKYRVYDNDAGGRGPIEPAATNGYSLAATRDPAYQLQFSYHHSAVSSFGLALGRDVETYTSSYDPTNTAQRQLTFMGQHWLTPAWALSYDVLYNDPANMSTLRLQGLGLRLGVRYHF